MPVVPQGRMCAEQRVGFPTGARLRALDFDPGVAIDLVGLPVGVRPVQVAVVADQRGRLERARDDRVIAHAASNLLIDVLNSMFF